MFTFYLTHYVRQRNTFYKQENKRKMQVQLNYSERDSTKTITYKISDLLLHTEIPCIIPKQKRGEGRYTLDVSGIVFSNQEYSRRTKYYTRKEAIKTFSELTKKIDLSEKNFLEYESTSSSE